MAEGSSPPHSPKSLRMRLWLLLLLAALGALLLFLGITGLRIVSAAGEHPAARADAIVVFGAAEYVGHPSPVYRARLDHGFALFNSGLAPVVITTCGAALDPDYSEGGVGRDYLLKRGVPEEDLIAETQGSDTALSAVRVANIMRTNGMHTCIAVSDAYHVFRIRELLQHEGIRVEVAPRPDSRPRPLLQRFWAVMREAASYLAWKVDLT
jgi:uncharacterized SAM-binding protein YcdF (DUF218 family)